MDAATPGQQASVSSDAAPLRLLLVSGQRCFLCEALAASLARDPAISSVGCAAAAELAPDLVIHVDALLVYAQCLEDIALAGRLHDAAPRTPIIGCGVGDTAAWAAAGATGHIPKTARLAQFLPRVKSILAGQQFCSPRMVRTACFGGGINRLLAWQAWRRNRRPHVRMRTCNNISRN